MWDTVSSLGLPMPFFIPQPPPRKLKFVNSRLCANIEHAFQALALHEQRRHFRPILWRDPPAQPENPTVKQCWFLGCHGDVGGGAKEEALSHISLIWMMAQLHPFLSMDLLNIFPRDIDVDPNPNVEGFAGAEPRSDNSKPWFKLTESELRVDLSIFPGTDSVIEWAWREKLRGLNSEQLFESPPDSPPLLMSCCSTGYRLATRDFPIRRLQVEETVPPILERRWDRKGQITTLRDWKRNHTLHGSSFAGLWGHCPT